MEHYITSLLQTPLHPKHFIQIHAQILTHLPHLTPLLYNHLSSPAAVSYAHHLFDTTPHPDPALPRSLILTYSKLSLHQKALHTFFSSHRKQIQVTFLTLPPILKSCAALTASTQGKQLHCLVLTRGYCSNVYIQTALIDFYVKNAELGSARRVFDEIEVRDPVPCNCLITGYSRAGEVVEARRLFDGMGERTAATWNTMISCYAHAGDLKEAMRLFERMQMEEARPNEITVVTVLSICAKLGDLERGVKVKMMIDDHPQRGNLIVRTAILEMYVKCGAVDEARMEFDQMERRDVVAWSAMIAGYAQNGRSNEALELFERMKLAKFKPNEVTLVSVLSACAQLGSVEVGQSIGSYIENQGLAYGIYVGSAMIDMYSKCGNIVRARQVFDRLEKRDIVSWNSMIGGLAVNGYAQDAIHLYEQMKEANCEPNDVTFVSLLTACTHAGLVELGFQFFNSMKENHKIVPKVEHCACIVDLLCRSGKLEDAYNFTFEMEMEPNNVIWGTLLSACRVHLNVKLAEHCVEKLLALEPENSSNYVLLANIYADAGMWEEARKVRDLMRSKNVQKLSGYSWIELDDAVHTFLIGDTSHQRSDEIYKVLGDLSSQLQWAGCDPDIDSRVTQFHDNSTMQVLLV